MIEFALSVHTTNENEGLLYYHQMPPMPVPRVGDDVFIPGPAMGYWTVVSVWWSLPSMGAQQPTMWATLVVKWAETNTKPRPVYTEDDGWKQAERVEQ